MDQVIAAAPGVRTGKFRNEFRATFIGMTATETGTGIFDLPTGRLLENWTESFFGESKNYSVLFLSEMEIYTKDGESNDWIRLSEVQINQLALPFRALATGQSVIYGFDDSTMVHDTYRDPHLSGSEIFNGIECFVVTCTFDFSANLEEVISTVKLPFEATISSEVNEARLFVGKDDYFVYGIDIEVTINISTGGLDVKIPMAMQEVFYDFNLPVEFPKP